MVKTVMEILQDMCQ